MSPLPEWCGARRIARHYGLTPEDVTAAAADNKVVFIYLPGREPDLISDGARLYYTPDFADMIRRAAEKRIRHIVEVVEKHLAKVIKNGGKLP
jgi:hypothetical protein